MTRDPQTTPPGSRGCAESVGGVRNDPTFDTRAELAAWAKQRIRYPDPEPDAKLRALDDIRRVTLAHMHLPFEDNPA